MRTKEEQEVSVNLILQTLLGRVAELCRDESSTQFLRYFGFRWQRCLVDAYVWPVERPFKSKIQNQQLFLDLTLLKNDWTVLMSLC